MFKFLVEELNSKPVSWYRSIACLGQAWPLHLPKELVANQMGGIMRRFWRGTQSKDTRSDPATGDSWNELCEPKGIRGLGFRRSEDTNRAVLSKAA